MKTLTFSIDIAAPRGDVWDAMLSPEGYRTWTAAFMEGSYFEGSWEQGQTIRFLSPTGEGMVSVIDESRRGEHVAIRHIGEVSAGVDDTTSPDVRAWAPASEKYSFNDADGGTRVTVEIDTLPGHEQFLRDAFPRALSLLKALCEGDANAGH